MSSISRMPRAAASPAAEGGRTKRAPLGSVDSNLVHKDTPRTQRQLLGKSSSSSSKRNTNGSGSNIISSSKKKRSKSKTRRKNEIYTPLVPNRPRPKLSDGSASAMRKQSHQSPSVPIKGSLNSSKSLVETLQSFQGEAVADLSGLASQTTGPPSNRQDPRSNNHATIPVVCPGSNQQPLILNFGYKSNVVGKMRLLPFQISPRTSEAPAPDATFPIELENVSYGLGFRVTTGGGNNNGVACSMNDQPRMIHLKEEEPNILYVAWTPTQEGEVREEIRLKSPWGKLHISVLGIARDVSQLPKSEDVAHFYARDNITYNAQQWEDKQCTTFMNWLNNLFHPEDITSTLDADILSAQLQAGRALFDSQKMMAIRCSVEKEVKEGRLAMTPRSNSRIILDEVRVQEQLAKLLLSYTPQWLQLGLGIVLAMNDDPSFKLSNQMTKESLKKIIMQSVLSKPSAIRKYTGGRCKTPSGKFESQMQLSVHQHALTQIMTLVFFLDKAKANRVLAQDPCLFVKSSHIKSSEGVLISLFQDCFSKERSLIKHLHYEGISVSHVQNPLDEYDFYLKNLAVDLKDGVCLAKMIDIVLDSSEFLASMRLPTTSRQYKTHNVNLALSALRHLGVPNISDITTAHIVDAHQPRILQLLWSSILHFELPEFKQDIIHYKAARLIQVHARRFLAMRSYRLAYRGTILFQALCRGFIVRMRTRRMHSAATAIQKIRRGYIAKRSYEIDLTDIITAQSAARRFLTQLHVHHMSRSMNTASTEIQRIWRGYYAKICYGCDVMDIITAQSVCRRFIADNQIARMSASMKGASVKIQRAWRGYYAKVSYGCDLMDIITAQSVCRRFVAQKQVDRMDNASTQIQRVWRGYYSKLSYGFDLMDIITVQSIGRRLIAQKVVAQHYYSIRKLQSLARMLAAKRFYHNLRKCIHMIQGHFRRVLASTHVRYLKSHIVRLQRVCRGWLCRKQDRAVLKKTARQSVRVEASTMLHLPIQAGNTTSGFNTTLPTDIVDQVVNIVGTSSSTEIEGVSATQPSLELRNPSAISSSPHETSVLKIGRGTSPSINLASTMKDLCPVGEVTNQAGEMETRVTCADVTNVIKTVPADTSFTAEFQPAPQLPNTSARASLPKTKPKFQDSEEIKSFTTKHAQRNIGFGKISHRVVDVEDLVRDQDNILLTLPQHHSNPSKDYEDISLTDKHESTTLKLVDGMEKDGRGGRIADAPNMFLSDGYMPEVKVSPNPSNLTVRCSNEEALDDHEELLSLSTEKGLSWGELCQVGSVANETGLVSNVSIGTEQVVSVTSATSNARPVSIVKRTSGIQLPSRPYHPRIGHSANTYMTQEALMMEDDSVVLPSAKQTPTREKPCSVERNTNHDEIEIDVACDGVSNATKTVSNENSNAKELEPAPDVYRSSAQEALVQLEEDKMFSFKVNYASRRQDIGKITHHTNGAEKTRNDSIASRQHGRSGQDNRKSGKSSFAIVHGSARQDLCHAAKQMISKLTGEMDQIVGDADVTTSSKYDSKDGNMPEVQSSSRLNDASVDCLSTQDAFVLKDDQEEISFTTRHASRKRGHCLAGKIKNIVDEMKQTSSDLDQPTNSDSALTMIDVEAASVRIQKVWRSYRASIWFDTKKKSVIMCQTKWRKITSQREDLMDQYVAATKISSAYRTHVMCVNYTLTLASVITIQKQYRKHSAYKIVMGLKCLNDESATIIQRHYRRRVCQFQFTTVLNGVMSLQSHVRGWYARKIIRDTRNERANAATVLQKIYRGFAAFDHYLVTKFAAIIIQSSLRRYVVATKYCSMQRSALIIQAAVRGMKARRETSVQLEHSRVTHRAASHIQRMWRGYMANIDFMLLILAAIKIQSCIRRHVASIKFHRMIQSVVGTQANFRGRKVRQTIAIWQVNSVILQTAGRRFLARLEMQRIFDAVTKIQRVARTMIAKMNADIECFAATEIQRVWRGYVVNMDFTDTVISAIMIQAAIRGAQARWDVAIKQNAVETLQRAARSMIDRVHSEVEHFASVEIQRVWRGYKSSAGLSDIVTSVIMIQAAVRGRKARLNFAIQKNAVITLQRAAKTMLVHMHSEVEFFAASEVQRIWRGYVEKTDFMFTVMSAISIQALVRGSLTRHYIAIQSESICILQKVGRGFLAKLKKRRAIAAVSTLQKAARDMIVRINDSAEWSAAINIQRFWRGYSSNVDYMLMVVSAMTIQNFTRRIQAEAKAQELTEENMAAGALRIIVKHGGILANKRNEEERALRLNCKENLPPKAYSGSASMKKGVRGPGTTQVLSKSHQGTATSEVYQTSNQTLRAPNSVSTSSPQAVARPSHFVSSVPNNRSTHALSKLFQAGPSSSSVSTASAVDALPETLSIASPDLNSKPVTQFGRHTHKAIRTIQKSKKFDQVLRAVMNLEIIAQQSTKDSKLIVEAKLHQQMFSIIRGCNRSSPHLELIRAILSVLINLSEHPSVLTRLASIDAIDALTDLIHLFRDKSKIFVLASSLLEKMLLSSNQLLLTYSSPENKRRLRGILSLCKKKAPGQLDDMHKGIYCLENVYKEINLSLHVAT